MGLGETLALFSFQGDTYMLSKRSVTTTINNHKYKLQKWNTKTVFEEGTELLKVVSPSLTMLAGDLIDGTKSADQELFEDVLSSKKYALTEAFSVLNSTLTREHISALVDKTLSGLSYYDSEEEEWVKVDDYSDLFDQEEYEADFLDVLFWTLKENLYSFFIKQGMFNSKIRSLSKLVKSFVENMPKSEEKQEDLSLE